MRLTKITTKTGDSGQTSLGNGSRVSKDDIRIEALGEIDELNCVLGMLLAQSLPTDLAVILQTVQHRLFDLGSELAVPGFSRLNPAAITELEQAIESYNATLPPLKEFILPGGSPTAALCHFARAVCRRAERRLVSLHQQQALSAHTLIYVNRLSDWLFIMARLLIRHENSKEILWKNHP
jgi:cob(I)alamin adenosyltransferase